MQDPRSSSGNTSNSIRQEASIANENLTERCTKSLELKHRSSSRNDKDEPTVSTRPTAYVHVAALDSSSWTPDALSCDGSIDCAVKLEAKQVKDNTQQKTHRRLRRCIASCVVLAVIALSVLVPVHLIVGFTPKRPVATSTVLQPPHPICKLVFAFQKTAYNKAEDLFPEHVAQHVTEWTALPSSGIHVAAFRSHEVMQQAAAELAQNPRLRYLVSDFRLLTDRKLHSIVTPDKLLQLSSLSRNLLQQQQGTESKDSRREHSSIDEPTAPPASRLAHTHSRRLAERKARRQLLERQRQLLADQLVPSTARQGQQLKQKQWAQSKHTTLDRVDDDRHTINCHSTQRTSKKAPFAVPQGNLFDSTPHSEMHIDSNASDVSSSSHQRRLQQYQEQPPSPEPQPQQRQALVQPQRGGTGVAWHLVDPLLRTKEAWNITYGLDELVVAVIDSGIELSHGSVGAAVWANAGEIAADGLDNDGNGYIDDVMGWDFGGSCADAACTACTPGPDPSDVAGWGTHAAAVIAAQPEVTAGTSGLAPGVRVMALKVSDCRAGLQLGDYSSQQLADGAKYVADSVQSSSEEATAAGPVLLGSAALQALDYAWSNGAHIVLAAWQAGSIIGSATPESSVSSNSNNTVELMPCVLGEEAATGAGLQAGLATAETAAACLASVQRLAFEDALRPLEQARMLVITMQPDGDDGDRSSSSAATPCDLGLTMKTVLCLGPSRASAGDVSGLNMQVEAAKYFEPLIYTMNRNLTAEAEERNAIESPDKTSNSGSYMPSQSAAHVKQAPQQVQLRAPSSNILAGWAWGSHAVVSGGSTAAAIAAGAAALTWSALGQSLGAAASPGALEGLGQLVKQFLLAGREQQQRRAEGGVDGVLLESAAPAPADVQDLDLLQTMRKATAFTGPFEVQPAKMSPVVTAYSNTLSYSWYIATTSSGAYETADMGFVHRKSLTSPFFPLTDWEFYGDASLVEVEGYLTVDTPGNYSIAAMSDDRFVLWFGDKWLTMQQVGEAGSEVGLPSSAWVVGVNFESAGLCKLRIIIYSPFTAFDLQWRLPGSDTFTNPTQFANFGHRQSTPQLLHKQVTRHMLLSSKVSNSRGSLTSDGVSADSSDIPAGATQGSEQEEEEANSSPGSISDGSSISQPLTASMSHTEAPSAFAQHQTTSQPQQQVVQSDHSAYTQPGHYAQQPGYNYPGLFGFGGFSSFLDSIFGYTRGWERGSRTGQSDNTDANSNSISSSDAPSSPMSASSAEAHHTAHREEVPKPSRLLLGTEQSSAAQNSSALPGVFSVGAALVPPSEYRTILPGLSDLQFTHTGILPGPGLEVADIWQLQQQLLGYADRADDRAVYGVVQGWVDWQAANSAAYTWLGDFMQNEAGQLGRQDGAEVGGMQSAGVAAASVGVQFELQCASADTQMACALHIDGHVVVGALDETQISSCVVPARRLLPVSSNSSTQQAALQDAIDLQRYMHAELLFAAGDVRAVTLAVNMRPCSLGSEQPTGSSATSSGSFAAVVAAPGASALGLSAAAIQDVSTSNLYQRGMVCTVSARVPAAAGNASKALERVVHLTASQLRKALVIDDSAAGAPGINSSAYTDTHVEATAKTAAGTSGIGIQDLAPDWPASLPSNTVFSFTCGCYWNGSWAGNVSVGIHAGTSGSASLYLDGWPVAAGTTLPLYGPSDIDISLYSSWQQQQQLMSGSSSADSLKYLEGGERITYAQHGMSAESWAAAIKQGFWPAELWLSRSFALGRISGAGVLNVPDRSGWFQLLVVQGEGMDANGRVVVAAALSDLENSDDLGAQPAAAGWLLREWDAWVPKG